MEKTHGGIAISDSSGLEDIIFAPKPKSIQVPVCDKSVTTEISEDFSLPDYLPEIRRLLRVTPTISVPSRYIGGNLVEFSGNVNWCIQYVGSESGIVQTQLSSPYEVSAEFDSEASPDSNFEAFNEITPENVSGRVTAPRRISIRCRLNHHILAYGDRRTDTAIYGNATAESIKRLTRTIPANHVVSGTDDSVELEDTFPLPADSTIIGANGSVMANNCSVESGGMLCHGIVFLKLLYKNANGELSSVEHKLPFSSNAEASAEGDGWECRAYGEITDLSTEMNGNDAVCHLRVTIACEAQKNLPAQFTVDMFSTDNEGDIVTEQSNIICSLCCDNYSFSHDGSAVIDGVSEGAQVLDSMCYPEPGEITLENGQYVLTGKCRYNVLFGAGNEYSTRETELPFRFELGKGSEIPHKYFVNMSAGSSRVRPEGENMAFGAELSAAVRICGETDTEIVREANFDRKLQDHRAAFTVAYTPEGKTLWDIAKLYSADPSELAEANGLRVTSPDSPDSLAGIKYLII